MVDQLTAMGFAPAATTLPNRISLAIEGGDSVGKTRLALTAPGPITWATTEPTGLEGDFTDLLHKVRTKTYCFTPRRAKLVMATNQILKKEGLQMYSVDDGKEAVELWNQFREDHINVVKLAVSSRGEAVRTIVWDGASDLYQFCCLAHFLPLFGRGEQIMPIHYNMVTSDFGELLKRAINQPYTNFITIWKEKPVYEKTAEGKDYLSSKKEIIGPGKLIDYEHRVRLRLWRDNVGTKAEGLATRYRSTILKCISNPMLRGESLEDVTDYTPDAITFPKLAAMATLTGEEEWT